MFLHFSSCFLVHFYSLFIIFLHFLHVSSFSSCFFMFLFSSVFSFFHFFIYSIFSFFHIRDVLSFALETSDSFPAEPTCVSFWSAQCELCRFVWHSAELCGCCSQCGLRRIVRHIRCLFSFPLLSRQFILCTRRHGMRHGSRKSCVSI